MSQANYVHLLLFFLSISHMGGMQCKLFGIATLWNSKGVESKVPVNTKAMQKRSIRDRKHLKRGNPDVGSEDENDALL